MKGKGVNMKIGFICLEIMQGLKADGLEKEDHASIVKYYEKVANIVLV